jgi:hypothetical protein
MLPGSHMTSIEDIAKPHDPTSITRAENWVKKSQE